MIELSDIRSETMALEMTHEIVRRIRDQARLDRNRCSSAHSKKKDALRMIASSLGLASSSIETALASLRDAEKEAKKSKALMDRVA